MFSFSVENLGEKAWGRGRRPGPLVIFLVFSTQLPRMVGEICGKAVARAECFPHQQRTLDSQCFVKAKETLKSFLLEKKVHSLYESIKMAAKTCLHRNDNE